MKVLAAMSGGVDSSVAAALAKEAGWEVIGVTMKLWKGPGGEAPTAGCCTAADAEDARRVAASLDIPYYVWDYTSEFMSGVVSVFIDEYISGRTPNPCVECNRTVKFSRLLAHAEALGCDAVVTGHYARITEDEDGRRRLWRGADSAKDQSYVLSMLGQRQLSRLRFPVGEIVKEETRRIAAELGIRTAAKPDSQDICFAGEGGYRDFLAGQGVYTLPGPIVDRDGQVLGYHGGVSNYTIGQRRGLGVAVGIPRYVIDIDPDTDTVTVGAAEDLDIDEAVVGGMRWVNRPEAGFLGAQYRAHGRAVTAEVSEAGEGKVRVRFTEPQRAAAAGQTLALYRGDEVVGGGIIESAA